MKTLPEYLYHYTSFVQMQWIVEDRELKRSPSNLKLQDGPVSYEPIIRNGEVVGQRAKNKYANYHPVVWLTANAAAAANETGLYEAKTEARFVIPTEDLKHHILHWPEFTAKYHASPDAVRALKQANGGDWKNWYVCDCPISLGLVDKIEVRTEDGSYRPKYIIHREE